MKDLDKKVNCLIAENKIIAGLVFGAIFFFIPFWIAMPVLPFEEVENYVILRVMQTLIGLIGAIIPFIIAEDYRW